MKILFITATRIGDAVLSTGALDHFIRTYPDAEITVACGPLVAGLFAPAPRVVRVIALKKESWDRHWWKLLRETMAEDWDIIVDLRNSAVSRFLRGKKKFIWRGSEKAGHKVDQIAAVLGAAPAPAPILWLDHTAQSEADRLIPAGAPFIAIGPTANWAGKAWPAENFIALVNAMTAQGSILEGARVAVFAAPGEEAAALPVLNALPAHQRIDMIAKASPLTAAAAIRRAEIYIGNDSGLTHIAAAVGTPTLALFGYGWPELYRPWGKHAAYISTPETPEQLLAGRSTRDIKSSVMGSLTVTAAVEAAVRLWDRTRKN